MYSHTMPASVQINEIVYYASDMDTPTKMIDYIKLYEYIISHAPGVIV